MPCESTVLLVLKVYTYFFLFGLCVKADAATFLTGAGVLGLLSNLAAIDATFFEVFSSFPIFCSLLCLILRHRNIHNGLFYKAFSLKILDLWWRSC